MMKISDIEPNREQPRKNFDKEALEELADSIRQFGIIQPIVVQKKDDYYEIIAGERRWRAAKLAKVKEVPVVIKEYTKQVQLESVKTTNMGSLFELHYRLVFDRSKNEKEFLDELRVKNGNLKISFSHPIDTTEI